MAYSGVKCYPVCIYRVAATDTEVETKFGVALVIDVTLLTEYLCPLVLLVKVFGAKFRCGE